MTDDPMRGDLQAAQSRAEASERRCKQLEAELAALQGPPERPVAAAPPRRRRAAKSIPRWAAVGINALLAAGLAALSGYLVWSPLLAGEQHWWLPTLRLPDGTWLHMRPGSDPLFAAILLYIGAGVGTIAVHAATLEGPLDAAHVWPRQVAAVSLFTSPLWVVATPAAGALVIVIFLVAFLLFGALPAIHKTLERYWTTIEGA